MSFSDFTNYVKQDRYMSLKHWRYRLLFWVMGVSAKTKEEAIQQGVPRYFFEHLCPLFHASNIFAIALPLIIVFKCFKTLIDFVWEASWEWKDHKKTKKEEREASAQNKKNEARKFLIICLKANPYFLEYTSEEAWTKFFRDWVATSVFTYEEFDSVWNQVHSRLVEKNKRDAARREQLKAKMLYWTAFGELFVKIALNVFYVCAATLSIYGLWKFGYLILFPLWNIGVLALVLEILKIFLWILLAFFTSLFLYKLLEKQLAALAEIAVGIFGGIGQWIVETVGNVVEFCQMFYTLHCPAVHILENEEEELIEKGGTE
jgi:hypothetical protein